MKHRDRERLKIILQILKQDLTQKEGSDRLGLSLRQIKRLCRRVRTQGRDSVRHALVARPSNHRIKGRWINKVIARLRKYQIERNLLMITPTVASWLIWKSFSRAFPNGISRYPLRRILVEAGLWKPGYQIVWKRSGRRVVATIVKRQRQAKGSV